MTDQLAVLLRGQIVGDWSRNRLGQYTFTYRENYRSTGRVPLSPALPISDTWFAHRAVAAYVEGLLPENPDVRAAWASELKTSETAFELLAAMGRDCVGAVQFAHENALDELAQRAADYRPVTDTEIGERLAALRATVEDDLHDTTTDAASTLNASSISDIDIVVNPLDRMVRSPSASATSARSCSRS